MSGFLYSLLFVSFKYLLHSCMGKCSIRVGTSLCKYHNIIKRPLFIQLNYSHLD
jgi:hypothetical protein